MLLCMMLLWERFHKVLLLHMFNVYVGVCACVVRNVAARAVVLITVRRVF